MSDRIMSPSLKYVYVLIPKIYKSVMLHGKVELRLQMGLRLQTS